MERPAEFDLERALAEWRAGFENLSELDGKELAAHLRQAFEELHGLGLAPEEAWLVARHRLGSPAELEVEFARAEGRVHLGRMRIVLGFVLLNLAFGISRTASYPLTFALGVRGAGGVLVTALLLGGLVIALLAWIASRVGQLSERELARMFRWRALGVLALFSLFGQWGVGQLMLRFARSEAVLEGVQNGDFGYWMGVTLASAPLVLTPLLLTACLGLLYRRSERRAQRERILASLAGRALPPNGQD